MDGSRFGGPVQPVMRAHFTALAALFALAVACAPTPSCIENGMSLFGHDDCEGFEAAGLRIFAAFAKVPEPAFENAPARLKGWSVVVKPEREVCGLAASGCAECDFAALVIAWPEGTTWQTSALAHEAAHGVQRCVEPAGFPYDGTHPGWTERGIYAAIGEANGLH